MTAIRLVTSPGASYIDEVLAALSDASTFALVTGFASVAGVDLVAGGIRSVLERGGQGRILIAVDRQGFNTAEVFRALLGLRSEHGARLSLGVVLQGGGLLHAKALLCEGPRGTQLLVGSANLTRSALGTNHELGVLLADAPQDIRRSFHQFVTSIAPRSLDGADAESFLTAIGLLPPKSKTRPPRTPPPPGPSIVDWFRKTTVLPPLDVPSEEHLAGWIRRGYLVGRGRRSLDALVLRLPQEQLVKNGYILTPKAEALGVASHESRSVGYGIDLIPTCDAESLRRDARRVSLLLAKLTLNLPCFGLWMPETFWEVFLGARESLQATESLDPTHVGDVAERHRGYLQSGGLETEVDHILERLEKLRILVTGKRDPLRALLIRRFHSDLELRTPEVLAGCVEFRTSRQRWTPFEQTEVPYRQLMVDIIQATFAGTYRSGDWPHRFRSHAARQVATAIAQRLEAGGGEAGGANATATLSLATTWEDAERPMTEVVEEFRRFVADDLIFQPPSIGELATTGGPGQDEGEAGIDDDVR